MAFIRENNTLHIAQTETTGICGTTGTPADRINRNDLICGRCLPANTEDLPYGTTPIIRIDRWIERQLNQLTHDEYLTTTHWQTIRRLAREYYGDTCVLCNKTPIQVHHRHYNTPRGHEKLEDLIVLCDNCHHTYHRRAS